jgi:hypothetical protein
LLDNLQHAVVRVHFNVVTGLIARDGREKPVYDVWKDL